MRFVHAPTRRRDPGAPLRVGMMSPYSLTVPGGVQSQILSLARALRATGVEVRVLGPCDGAPPEPGVTPLGVSLPTAANGSIAPIAPDVPAQLRTMRALGDERFDVLHLHEPIAPGPTMTATLLKPCPIIGTFHAAGGSLAYTMLNRGTRYLAGRLDIRCAVSAAAEEMAHHALGGTYERVFNGVEIAPFASAKLLPTEGPTVFFVGRHEERKGLAVLLDALAHLPESVIVQVAGDGPETDRLQAEYLDPRIRWLGRISESEKRSYLRSADVFCAPSLRGESFGVVLLEAMAAQTSIVATELEGYRAVAEDGIHARLVPVGDPVALAAGIRSALFGGDDTDRLVMNGAKRAERYSMRSLADRYLELYGQMLDDAGTPRR